MTIDNLIARHITTPQRAALFRLSGYIACAVSAILFAAAIVHI